MSDMPIELASTYVRVGISAEGLGQGIVKSLKGSTSTFATVLGKAGKTGGNAFTKAFAGQSKGVETDAKTKQDALTKTVESATARVAKARESEAAAARKVEIAQAKLNEVKSKQGATDSQILTAQDRLVNAQARQATAARRVENEVTRLKGAQNELKSATEGATASSQRAAKGIGAAFAGASKSVGKAAGAMRTGLSQALSNIKAGNWSALRTQAIGAFNVITTSARRMGESVAAAIRDRIPPSAVGAFNTVTSAARRMGESVAAVIRNALKGDWSAIGRQARGAFDSIVTSARSAAKGVGSAFASVKSSVGAVGDTIKKAFTGDIKGALADVKGAAGRVGGAFKNIGGSLSGLAGRVGGALKSVVARFRGDGAAAGQQFVEGAEQNMGSGQGSRIGGMFRANFLAGLAVNAITGALKGVGKAISGAFSGGWNRLMNIDEAKIKLQTLGIDTEAAMARVNSAVDGTRFAISDAADMAAQLGAGGMQAGAEMERWLKMTGDMAQFANKDFAEMQQLVQQVALEGRVTGETLNRFPLAASALSEKLGVTQAEVRELASQGKISADDFASAIEGKIGGAAQNAGASFGSMMANVKTAMAAGMANLLEPFKNAAIPLAGAFLGVAKGIRDGITKPLGEALGGALEPFSKKVAEDFSPEKVQEQVTAWSGKLISGVQGAFTILSTGEFPGFEAMGFEEDSGFVTFLFGVRDAFTGLKDAVGGFVEGFGGTDVLFGTLKDLLPVLMGPLGMLKSAFTDVFAGEGIDMAGFGRTVGEVLGPIAQTAAELAATLTGALGTALAAILPAVIDVATVLGEALGDALTQIAPVLGRLAVAVMPLFAQIVAALAPVVAQLVGALAPLIAGLVAQLAPILVQIVQILLPPLMRLFQALVPVVVALLQAIMPVVTTLVAALAPILVTLVQALLPPLARVLGMVADVITTVVLPIIEILAKIISVLLVGAIKALMPIVATVFGFVATTIGNAMDVISGIITLVMAIIRGDWSTAWNAIKQIASAVWSQIKATISFFINLIKSIIVGVLVALKAIWTATWEAIKWLASAAWRWLRDTAISIFNALKDRTVAIWTGLRDRVVGLANNVKNWVLDRFRSLKAGAEDTFRKMVEGIKRIWNGLKEAAKAPVKFVIETVLNKGLIGGWNALIGLLKLPDKLKVGKIKMPEGFAGGGRPGRKNIVPGRRSDGVDSTMAFTSQGAPIARVDPGEGIIRYASMRKLDRTAPGAFEHINRTGTLPGFFHGGRIPTPGPVRPHGLPYYGARWAGDMGYGMGSPVYAWNDGQVSTINRWGYSYGHHIRINHGGLGQSLYAHLSRILVSAGQLVKQGDKIGEIGSTGKSTGPHLHFEIRGGNAPIGQGVADEGGGGLFSMATQWITDKLKAPVEKFLNAVPGAGVFKDAAVEVGKMALDKAMDKIRSIIPSFGDNSMSGGAASASWVDNATLLMKAGKQLGASRRAMKIALMTAAQESSMGTNRTAMTRINSDGDVGWFQQRATRGDGTVSQLADPLYALRVFLFGTRANNGWHVPGLYNKAWQNMGLGQAAQAVQVSAFPRAYDKWADEAESWLRGFGYASGTVHATPGWHLVGEEGPELVRFRGGEKVLDAADTGDALGGPRQQFVFSPQVRNGDQDLRRSFEDFMWDARQAAKGVAA